MPCDVRCSHCSQQLQVLDEHLGKPVRCPKCYQVFTAEKAASVEVAPAVASPAPEGGIAAAPYPAAPKFCPHCGAALTTGASFCAACGRSPFQTPAGTGYAAAPSMPSFVPTPYSPAQQTSGLAVASLVLGILNYVACGTTFIPGIVCGHMAHARIRDSGGTIGGSGLATWGLAINYIAAAFVIFGILMAVAGA